MRVFERRSTFVKVRCSMQFVRELVVVKLLNDVFSFRPVGSWRPKELEVLLSFDRTFLAVV